MGRSFYDGNLPYIQLWDGKPPMHHIILGSAFKLFGPEFLIGRLTGDFLILLSSICVYLLARKTLNQFSSVLSSILYVTFVSLEFAQPTMTEYSSTLFILFALLVFNENSKTNIFLSGVFISLAFFTRTNTAFVAVAFFFVSFKKKKRINVFNIWWINPTNNFFHYFI